MELLHHIINEIMHASAIEILKTFTSYIIYPVALLILIYIFYRFKSKLIKFKKWINDKIIAIKFDKIYNDGNREKLQSMYINNTLKTAQSTDAIEKKNAIKQLSQYSEDLAFEGAIDLLKNEKDLAFKYLLIKALSKMVENRNNSD